MVNKDREKYYAGVDKNKLHYWGEELDQFDGFKRELNKYMLLRKDGKAIHLTGDISRHEYDAELIYIYNEIPDYWIGQFCEGFGFMNIKFKKEDCRMAKAKEIKLFEKGLGDTVQF